MEAATPAFPDSKVLISIYDPEVIADLRGAIALQATALLLICQAQSGIVESVTADNVLVTPELMRDVHAAAMAGDGDAVVILSTREDIHAAHPEGQRRFHESAHAAISNCKLFWLRNANALKAAEAFRQGWQFIRTKGRIAKAFGIIKLATIQAWMVDAGYSVSCNIWPSWDPCCALYDGGRRLCRRC